MNQFKMEEAESLWSGLVKGGLTHPTTISRAEIVNLAMSMCVTAILLPW